MEKQSYSNQLLDLINRVKNSSKMTFDSLKNLPSYEQRLISAANGIAGDYLQESKSPWAIKMTFFFDGLPVDLEAPSLKKNLKKTIGISLAQLELSHTPVVPVISINVFLVHDKT